MSETTPAQFRAFIQDLLDDLAATIDDPGTTQEQWLRFAAHWGDQSGDLVNEQIPPYVKASFESLLGDLVAELRRDIVAEVLAELRPILVTPEKPRPFVPDAELRLIAATYLRAVRAGKRPIVAIQREFGLTRATANRRVRAARDVGLLPPTRREQAL